MSTYFRPSVPISLKKVKELSEFGILENVKIVKTVDQKHEVLHDGKNYIHFDTDKDGNIIDLYRYGTNDETDIFDAIQSQFDVDFFSEYEDEYVDLESKDTNVINISIER